jgi:hypothetical protein
MRISPFAQFLFVPGQSIRGGIAPSVSAPDFQDPVRIDPNADGSRSELSNRRGPQFDFRQPQFANQLLLEAQEITFSAPANDRGVASSNTPSDSENDLNIVQITTRSSEIASNRYAEIQNLGLIGRSLSGSGVLDIPSPSVNTVI